MEIININFLSIYPNKSLRRQYMAILFANEREKVISKTEKLKYPISYPKNIWLLDKKWNNILGFWKHSSEILWKKLSTDVWLTILQQFKMNGSLWNKSCDKHLIIFYVDGTKNPLTNTYLPNEFRFEMTFINMEIYFTKDNRKPGNTT